MTLMDVIQQRRTHKAQQQRQTSELIVNAAETEPDEVTEAALKADEATDHTDSE